MGDDMTIDNHNQALVLLRMFRDRRWADIDAHLSGCKVLGLYTANTLGQLAMAQHCGAWAYGPSDWERAYVHATKALLPYLQPLPTEAE